jgi:hypothetical protein
MTDNTITDRNPTVAQMAEPGPTNAGDLTNPAKSPLQSSNPKIRQAWQVALFNMRKKNRAGRPPL